MANNGNMAYSNQVFYGEPADQHMPQRSRDPHQLQQGGFYLVGHQPGSHTLIQMQVLDPNAQFQPAPGVQYMVRNSSSPMPTDEENGELVYLPSLGGIIFKRIVSAIFIILDVCLNWIQYASWVGNFEAPTWLGYLETLNSLKGKAPLKSQCSEGSADLTSAFGAIAGVGTAYACLRIVNMIGETLLEYQLRDKSETEPKCRGFQIIHGWMETALATLCDDLPQAILLTLFSVQCVIDYTAMTKLLIWALIKIFKNGFRATSCKQKYKQCCQDCCKDCWAYKYDFICCCRLFIFRPFGCCCQQECCECIEYQICPDCSCTRNGRCFGNIEEDPKWALRGYKRLQKYYIYLQIAIVVLFITKDNGYINETHQLF